MSEWISVKDRLPRIYDFVLVLANNKGTNEPKPMSIARWDHHRWEFINHNPPMPNYGAYMDMEYNMDCDDITHWAYLPNVPIDIEKCNHMYTWMPKEKRICLNCGKYE